MGSKKHKKHKSERWDRYESTPGQGTERPQLRLILKVGGGASTPELIEHGENSFQSCPTILHSHHSTEEDSQQSSHFTCSEIGDREKHKKKKEKKKKKNKDKDKEKKKHKHKDKKRKERDEFGPDDGESFHYEVVSVQPVPSTSTSVSSPRPILKISTTPHEGGALTLSATLSTRGHRTSPGPLRTSLRPRQERPALQKLLELVLPNLERKDPRQFFAWPVTDNIAPGYSKIITRPMDFSTMKQKIEENHYKTLQEFTDDFILMCNNAMTYNQPDTVYYKAAKRLLHTGLRTLLPEKVRPLVPTISNYGELTAAHLGFEPLEESFKAFAIQQQEQTSEVAETGDHDMEAGFSSGGETMPETARDIFLKNESPTKNQIEGLPDDMTAEEILEQVQEAAQVAANKIKYRHPNARMGFIRQRKDGTTSLAILAPCDPGAQPGTTEVPITLGALTGKVHPGPGSGQLTGFREDRRNIAKPVKPLYYGPFGSYAPSYDSTFANLTKEESDLVLSTYGEETGVPYAESILDFVRDCDYALHIADDLLNLMTHSEHTAVARILEEKRRIHHQQMLQQLEVERLHQEQLTQSHHFSNDDPYNINALRTLGDLGIDVSFLDTFEAQLKEELRARQASQSCLDQTGSLLSALERTQRERLSKTPPPHLSNVMQPSEYEVQLAEKITAGIALVAKQTTPSSVASVQGVRKAMGVSLDSLPEMTAPAPMTQSVSVDQDQRDIESELSRLLGEDGVSDAMADIFP